MDANELKKLLGDTSRGGIPTTPTVWRPSANMTMALKIPSIWEKQAEMYMEGLRAQVEELEASVQANEEVAMTCWHGSEKFQVLSVSMPSDNVVALKCQDADGAITQLTGHMNSVTFSFRIVTTKEPDIAAHYKIAYETLQGWFQKYPTLKQAFDNGRESERQSLHNALYRKAMNGDPHRVCTGLAACPFVGQILALRKVE